MFSPTYTGHHLWRSLWLDLFSRDETLGPDAGESRHLGGGSAIYLPGLIMFALADIRSRTAVNFPRRTYRSWTEPIQDMVFLARNLRLSVSMRRRELLPPAFRERLMLAVTAVNQCRYCSWIHTREALKSGLSAEEIKSLLSGNLEDCPEEESLALLYAQHWAEANAKPDREWVDRLVEAYGTQKAQAIDLVLRMIRVGNLTSNSWDYLLYRVSFGRWGV